MRSAVVMLLVSAVAVTVAGADEMHGTVELGYFGDADGYAAPTLTVSAGDWWLYAEHAPEYNPDFSMLMVRRTLNEHWKVGVRYQTPDWWRPMIYWADEVGPWKTSVCLRGMSPGTNGAPERFDAFVTQPVTRNFSIFAWEFAQAGKAPDYWLGPQVATSDGKLSVWYGWNLRGEGAQAWIVNWRVCEF
jgi:hypothetical protein